MYSAARDWQTVLELQKWAVESVDEYELFESEKTTCPGFVEIAFHRRLAGSNEMGWDRYHIAPRENPFMFLVEDWKQVFS